MASDLINWNAFLSYRIYNEKYQSWFHFKTQSLGHIRVPAPVGIIPITEVFKTFIFKLEVLGMFKKRLTLTSNERAGSIDMRPTKL